MILFVGDRPSPKMKPGAKAFEGAACEKRLIEWISCLGVSRYEIVNSHKPTVEEWAAYTLAGIYKRPMITLGNEAHKRMKRLGYDSFKLPHPSGRNRQLNDKSYIETKLKECRVWLKSFHLP